MTYSEIEKHFKDEKSLNKLLEKYQEVFDQIDYYKGLLRGGALDSPHETDIALKEFTGLFISLNLVTTIAETEKINREVKHFHKKRIDIEKTGEKTTAAFLEKESSKEVSVYRRVRNIFQARRADCEKAISICQTSLNNYSKEWKLPSN